MPILNNTAPNPTSKTRKGREVFRNDMHMLRFLAHFMVLGMRLRP